jgi:hypothetical protein
LVPQREVSHTFPHLWKLGWGGIKKKRKKGHESERGTNGEVEGRGKGRESRG